MTNKAWNKQGAIDPEKIGDNGVVETDGAAGGDLGGTYPNPTVDDGADSTAIHDNVNGEINAITLEKTTPIPGDLLLIEDSEASFAKKKVDLENLLAKQTFRSYAECYGSGSTKNSVTTTPVKLFLGADGGTANEGLLNDFTHSNGRLTYTGTETKKFRILSAISFSSSKNNIVVSLYGYQGAGAGAGSKINKSEQNRDISSAGAIGAITLSYFVELAQNDWVEMWGNTDSDLAPGNIIIDYINFTVMEV